MKFSPSAGCMAALLLCAAAAAQEPIVGGPCEGCEYVFVDQPAQLTAQARIAPVSEAGTPLAIEGTVRGADGKPAANVIVYAYHTNAAGIYPPGTTRHGALRGWVRSDASGHYRFDTIRPGAYPGRNIPQHVHMHVIEPAQATYYIDDLVFTDDPLLTAARRKSMHEGRGGDGVSTPSKDAEGIWHVQRDIVLGRKVPGYPAARH